MRAIAVDDELYMLEALVEAVSASADISLVKEFSSCSAALAYVEENPVDVAFLDINMRGIGGLRLAEKIVEHRPKCKIIFCTGYEDYAVSAFQLHASGYLIKPITAEAVQREIDHIKNVQRDERLLTVKCFGTFEVLHKGQALAFKRTKAKELLALLIDRNGASMTGKQICAVLWSEDTDDAKNMDYFRHLMKDLRNALDAVGAGDVLCQEKYQYRIDPTQISCDYYNFLQYGTPAFLGEYMNQYSWAESTCGVLQK